MFRLVSKICREYRRLLSTRLATWLSRRPATSAIWRAGDAPTTVCHWNIVDLLSSSSLYYHHHRCLSKVARWCCGRVSHLRLRGRGFDSRPDRYQVVTWMCDCLRAGKPYCIGEIKATGLHWKVKVFGRNTWPKLSIASYSQSNSWLYTAMFVWFRRFCF